ncbi:unnamed protein product [Cuscuta epithymum]|uniref:Uncharacterized protein n=1 Tax=Cuscuta epithymum TaxID=186058 RepID=A0AAV0CXE1_9ASTE|nr:unnamed protein product [Cuscuta epithymum]CAH9136303.1 unnamed protein product [Cuscuta epithymum]
MLCFHQEKEDGESDILKGQNHQEGISAGSRFETGAIHHLSLLHLNSAAKRRCASTAAENFTSCGASAKRSPPSFLSSLPEPSPKRATLFPPSFSPATAAAAAGGAICSKPQSPLLYRSLSEPIDSLAFQNPKTVDFGSIIPFTHFLNSNSPEKSKNAGAVYKQPSPAKSSGFSPLPPPSLPPLYRSISDPSVAIEFQPPPQQQAATPPRAARAAQNVKSPPNSGDDSPSTKRLEKIKERMRQMRQWWDQVLQEEEEEVNEEDHPSEDDTSKIENEPEDKTASSQPEESVWVEEKGGEGLVIHFKCPCKKGYEILLSGNNCYYKLL